MNQACDRERMIRQLKDERSLKTERVGLRENVDDFVASAALILSSGKILIVADLLHPVGGLAVKLFLYLQDAVTAARLTPPSGHIKTETARRVASHSCLGKPGKEVPDRLEEACVRGGV